MVIEGVIENIIYRNEENGYTVCTLSHGNERDTIVGKFIEVKIGENIRLIGNYVTNSRYGEQFAFDSAEIIEPSTCEGIIKYLSSGLISGVGPVTAKAIVDCFGEDSLNIIEYSPQKLDIVRGISRKKAENISESFANLKRLQRTVMHLQKYDITVNLAMKIYDIYGDNTINIVENNPYKLVEDIDGIGFLTADKIAQKMGISTESEFRIRAGMLHCLGESASKQGHTYLPKSMLYSLTSKLLKISNDILSAKFNSILESLKLEKIITMLNYEGNLIVMSSKYYNIELALSKKLAMINYMADQSQLDVTSEITEFERMNKIIFHTDQKEAIKLAINNGVSVITGGPGTGKTTIIKCILLILKQMQQKVMLLAPTGRAAKRLSESTEEEAKTIHRALELEFFKHNIRFKYNDKNPLDVNCVIVDEVSMVDILLMHNLLKALPRNCRLILVGDKDQLPSVGEGNVLYDILKSGVIDTAFLTKIYRQDDASMIVTNAHLINSGEMPILDNSSNDFFYQSKEDPAEIKDTVLSLITERLPNYLNIDPIKIQVIAPLRNGVSGIDNLNISLQDTLNPPSLSKPEFIIGKHIYRKGDKVMQTINNYNMKWKKQNGYLYEEGTGVFNGDIGFIHNLDFKTGETTVWFDDGRESVYTRTELAELTLAYAITVHKSQGCEFDVVIIPIVAGAGIIFTRNLLYTAVTRAKKLVVLVGEKRNISRMVRNNFTTVRYTMLKTFLMDENKRLEEIYGENN